jgi:hypothetical protein
MFHSLKWFFTNANVLQKTNKKLKKKQKIFAHTFLNIDKSRNLTILKYTPRSNPTRHSLPIKLCHAVISFFNLLFSFVILFISSSFSFIILFISSFFLFISSSFSSIFFISSSFFYSFYFLNFFFINFT